LTGAGAVAVAAFLLGGCSEEPAPTGSTEATPLIGAEAARELQEHVTAAEEAAADEDWSAARAELRELRELVRRFERSDDIDAAKADTILQAVSQLEAALPVEPTESPSDDLTTPPPTEETEGPPSEEEKEEEKEEKEDEKEEKEEEKEEEDDDEDD
jgi:outer membrane murein-binding lipoprotein Lpp